MKINRLATYKRVSGFLFFVFLVIITVFITEGCSNELNETETTEIQIPGQTTSEKAQFEDTAMIGGNLETGRVSERNAWDKVRKGEESYAMLKISPFLKLEPGNTMNLSCEIWGGYANWITNIKLVPEPAVISQWPAQQLYQNEVDWPDPLYVPADSEYYANDSKTFQIVIPESITMPVNVEIFVSNEIAVYAGKKGLFGEEYSPRRDDRVYKVPLGLLVNVPDDEIFQLKDWLVTDGDLYSFSLRLNYNSAVDGIVTLTDSKGEEMDAMRSQVSDNITQSGTNEPSLLIRGTHDSSIMFADHGYDDLLRYNDGEAFTLEIRERYTNMHLLTKTLTYEKGEITIKSLENSWVYDPEIGNQRLENTSVTVHNSGLFPVGFTMADFIIEDKTSFKTWDWSSWATGILNPGDNVFTFKQDRAFPSGGKKMTIKLLAGVVLSRTEGTGKSSIETLHIEYRKIAEYQQDITVPDSPP